MHRPKGGFVYIISNQYNTTLYTGVTSDLVSRIMQHKTKQNPKCFTAKYNCNKLVYFEIFEGIEEAISREKYIKGKKRQFKDDLINETNSSRRDLWEDIKDW